MVIVSRNSREKIKLGITYVNFGIAWIKDLPLNRTENVSYETLRK